jgi:hypothetical protein
MEHLIKTTDEISFLADNINHVSVLLSEIEDWMKSRPSDQKWQPWTEPFKNNFPRKFPRISTYVDEAYSWIASGREGTMMEGPFEFYLVDRLDIFWTNVDLHLLNIQNKKTVPSFSCDQLNCMLKEVSLSGCNWQFERLENDIYCLLSENEILAMAGIVNDKLHVGPPNWSWPSQSDRIPKLVPIKKGGILDSELGATSAGVPILIDMFRRAIAQYYSRFRLCELCGLRFERMSSNRRKCTSCEVIVY